MLPIEPRERSRAAAVRAGFSKALGGRSDQLAVVAAYNGYLDASRVGKERAYAAANCVSAATMNMITGMRSQLLGELQV